MAQRDRAALEAFFQTGNKPTQEEFAEFIESVLNYVDDGNPFETAVEVKTASFTAEGGKPYRLEGAGTITVAVPTSAGNRISIVNAGDNDATVGSLGTLASGDSCVLYYDSSWKEYTARLS